MPRAKAAPTRRRNYGATGHGYYIDGEEVRGRGVTTLLKNGYPAPALVYWAGRTVAEAAVEELDVWEPILRARGPKAAIEYLKESPWKDRNEAGRKGTNVHDIAERLAKGEEVEVDDEAELKVDAFLKFWNEWQPAPLELAGGHLALEVCVINRTWRYGGTVDLIARMPWHEDGAEANVLIDYKTGRSGVFPDSGLQVTAYANAEHYLPVADGTEGERELAELDIEATAILWLHESGYDLIPVDGLNEAAFNDFLYVAQVAAITGLHKDDPGRAAGYLGEPIAPPSTPKGTP